MEKIRDINKYTGSMAASLEDKLWFLDHLPLKGNYTIVDFGCADGTLLNVLPGALLNNPQNTYVGFDISPEMIDLAKEKQAWDPHENVVLTCNWEKVENVLDHTDSQSEKVLILSSVIHEVYSYGTPESIAEFWDRVLQSDFDYIFVRDMMTASDIRRSSDLGMVGIILAEARLEDGAIEQWQIDSFEKHFGHLEESMQNVLHFLLKYRWKVNWEREVQEDYFPIDLDEFLDKWKETGKYNINYLERFQIPFIHDQIEADFGIDIQDNTHIKVFFEKKKD